MNINWVIATGTEIEPGIDINRLKELGSFWGSWRTWRGCQTDNVICHDLLRARELIDREFHRTCNFYVPNSLYASLDRPPGVKVYGGDFKHEVDNQEDIVAMHLVTTNSDIVLLYGFDFGEQPKLDDRLLEHRAHNYRSLTRQVIVDNPDIQWVIIDHQNDLRIDLQDLENLGKDTLQNILPK